jgi:hypothetical protein
MITAPLWGGAVTDSLGGMVEWLKTANLKFASALQRTVGSNPTPAASFWPKWSNLRSFYHVRTLGQYALVMVRRVIRTMVHVMVIGMVHLTGPGPSCG